MHKGGIRSTISSRKLVFIMASIGYPFFVVAENHDELIELVNELESEYGYISNLPLHDGGIKGTQGDFGCRTAFINIEAKTYWLSMPGVKFCQLEFDRPISDDDFRIILSIYNKNESRKFND